MPDAPSPPMPTLEDMQHWTWVLGRMQQMLLEHGLSAMEPEKAASAVGMPTMPASMPDLSSMGDMAKMAAQSGPAAMSFAQDLWSESIDLWRQFVTPGGTAELPPVKDRRFAAPQWSANPVFDLIRRSYLLLGDHLLKGVENLDGVDPRQRAQLRFAARGLVDALSPANYPVTNPQVLERTLETRGANLLKGLEHMLADIKKGQLTHSDPNAYELGRNIAATPGKVIKRTPLYELIQYTPTTDRVLETPVVIFPPWINRYYILDLAPEKSFIRWAVEQGLTVFVVSWKSADASMKDVVWDDYVEDGMIDAVDTVRALLKVGSVHTIGYCVAGTTLATTLAVLAARGQADKVASATFFTAQVDFTRAGELNLLISDEQLAMIEALSKPGYLDGRYMAVTFNLLRGRDLIWSYVTNNYLMGEDYAPFDLLHWNGDTTNLPATWHRNYLVDLYRDNKLVVPGGVSIRGTPVDLTRVRTPAYVQAGREDHIAPAESVWKITHHLKGPLRFILAGSGHIAGVINPPAAGKYQYWRNDSSAGTLDEFIAGATEHKGSWWPDWIAWLRSHGETQVPARGARVPGRGKLKAIEPAPGSYVRTR